MTGGFSRRRLLGYAAGSVAGAAVGAGAYALVDAKEGGGPAGSPPAAVDAPLRSPYGAHQACLELPPAAAQEVVAFDLRPEVDRAGLGRLLRSWTGSIEALTAGRGALGDPAPWLADAAAGLTITVGLGTEVARPDGLVEPPPGFGEIPAMTHDRLDPGWTGGDLVLLVGGREATTVAHAVRRLSVDAAPFATLRWRQAGSWNTRDAQGRPTTGRNFFGQLDGSANPAVGTELFADTVWIADGPWSGGTTLAVRRIRLDMATWDELTRHEQERSVGRDLPSGAPLTGGDELADLDLGAIKDGALVIAEDAHARRSHPDRNGGRRIFRRGANYIHTSGADVETGLLFQSFQADLLDQFVPIQQTLDALDALNEWTTAVGSAAFAILPGFTDGGWLGETLLA